MQPTPDRLERSHRDSQREVPVITFEEAIHHMKGPQREIARLVGELWTDPEAGDAHKAAA